jgi:hypothetical protein
MIGELRRTRRESRGARKKKRKQHGQQRSNDHQLPWGTCPHLCTALPFPTSKTMLVTFPPPPPHWLQRRSVHLCNGDCAFPTRHESLRKEAEQPREFYGHSESICRCWDRKPRKAQPPSLPQRRCSGLSVSFSMTLRLLVALLIMFFFFYILVHSVLPL